MKNNLIEKINNEINKFANNDKVTFKAFYDDEAINLIGITKNNSLYMQMIIDYQTRNCTCCAIIHDKHTEKVAKCILNVLEEQLKNTFS